MLFCHQLIFIKTNFFENFFQSFSLDLGQDRHFVKPDLGPNCLQTLPADNKQAEFTTLPSDMTIQ